MILLSNLDFKFIYRYSSNNINENEDKNEFIESCASNEGTFILNKYEYIWVNSL